MSLSAIAPNRTNPYLDPYWPNWIFFTAKTGKFSYRLALRRPATADQGKSQCHLEDVVVTCKRIKPGSVGMLPGKS